MTVRSMRRLGVCFVLLWIQWSVAAPAFAGVRAAVLRGRVTASGKPIAGVRISLNGNDETVRTASDALGYFTFAPLPLGTYDLTAERANLRAHLHVDLGSDGATIAVALQPLSEIHEVTVYRSSPVRGSGSDVTLDALDLERFPYVNSFASMLIQLPGAVRGANGVVHINGDHGVIDYQINGVALPQGLNRDIGSEIDLNDISYVDAIEGAYPAQYGLKFGAVLDLTTKSGTGPAGFDGQASAGSYTNAGATAGYHMPLPGGGGASVSAGGFSTTRGLDTPDFDSPHNDASGANQYLGAAIPTGANSFADVTLVHSLSSFQIPNDVEGGEPAATDDSETQADTFASVQFRHAMGPDGSLSFGPAFKISTIADSGDPVNDWIYGEALNVTPPPFGNGGSPSDCADALHTGTFAPTTCAYSLSDRRTATDYIVQADASQRAGRHELRAGLAYDLERVDKNYTIVLQQNNFLAPLLTPHTPNAATPVVDDSPNTGNTYQSYVQDSWHIDEAWHLDMGIRYDFFTIRSSQFARGFGAFSPRVKLTRSFGPRTNVYAYLGRFFEPFSFENVSPQAAQLLNLPLQPSLAQFDLKPERDTQLELGGHFPIGSGELGWRVWQKNANDLIDDTQVGVTLLHQDINYVLGRLSQEALDYVRPLARGGRAYVSIAHTVSLNKGCETQLLAPCFGSPDDFTPADHDQTYSANAGVLFDDARGGWFAADAEYGSGLSSDICPGDTPGFCKRTPHTIFSVSKGVAIGPRTQLTFAIQNLLNDRYYVTILNAQGNHFAAPRTFSLGVRFGNP
jgi:outer membrane receptor protein involved in Fe transport